VGAGGVDGSRRETSRDEYARLFDEIAAEGCLWLLLTGGEPLIREDFPDIYLDAKRRGLLITVFTNATNVTAPIADLLAEWPPFRVEVTVYGATPEAHEAVTRVPGSYRRCLDGIAALQEREIPLALKTMALTINCGELDAISQLAEALGVPFRFDAMINPRLDGRSGPTALRLSAQEIVALDLRSPKRVSVLREFAAQFVRPPVTNGGHPPLFTCSAGKTAFSVDPYGLLHPCQLSARQGYDLRRGSFHDGWQYLVGMANDTRATHQTKCLACHLRSLCGMCPETSWLECGDLETPVDFLCEVAHLRAMALGLTIPPHGECQYCQGGTRYESLREAIASLTAGNDGLRVDVSGLRGSVSRAPRTKLDQATSCRLVRHAATDVEAEEAERRRPVASPVA
jgi:radical SAM protein with 4Fe4S-binding SPASM domain